ncbi:MAG: sortase [Chloroflexota bacterium]|nr:sortase [Chloroflexota bacterium]
MALTLAAGVPGLAPPFGGQAPVATASATSWTRVSSLKSPTRATSISIARLGISLAIRNGTISGTISRRYAYHLLGTSWPGGRSNTYIYAHAQAGAFLSLWRARVGDIVVLRLATGQLVKYRVSMARSVAWNDMRWIQPTRSERITLQTCLGNTRTARRWIVVAVPAY